MIIAIKNPKTNKQTTTTNKRQQNIKTKHDFPKSIPFQKASLTLNGVPCIKHLFFKRIVNPAQLES